MKGKDKLDESEMKKRYLNSYLTAKRDVARLEEQLAELRADWLSPGRSDPDKMPRAHYVTDLSSYAAKMDKLERKIEKARYERINAFERVRERIESIEDEREKTLLTYRYLKGWDWEEIADHMGYSYRHISRIHRAALGNLIVS